MLQVDIRKTFVAGAAPFTLEVDFTAEAGITVLFGASGAGKSTTLDCVAGIVRPDAGIIRLGNRVLFAQTDAGRQGVDVALRERGVGYVFQNLGLFEHLTVLDNVRYGLAGLPRSARTDRARAILDRFRIGHTADRFPRMLSGGERQRVALARTLVVEPHVLLLDEPFSAVDVATKHSLIDEVRELRDQLDIPILYVSHDRHEMLTLGERVFVYHAGRIVFSGPPGEALRVAEDTAAGLERS